jgi:hypothetical protein
VRLRLRPIAVGGSGVSEKAYIARIRAVNDTVGLISNNDVVD